MQKCANAQVLWWSVEVLRDLFWPYEPVWCWKLEIAACWFQTSYIFNHKNWSVIPSDWQFGMKPAICHFMCHLMLSLTQVSLMLRQIPVTTAKGSYDIQVHGMLRPHGMSISYNLKSCFITKSVASSVRLLLLHWLHLHFVGRWVLRTLWGWIWMLVVFKVFVYVFIG